MRIQSTRKPHFSPGTQRPSQVPSTSSPANKPAWRRITLNEAAVEIPQGVLELSKLSAAAPRTAGALQAGVVGLAALRSAQAFHDAESLEEILEGVSSGALAVAGAASLFPGNSAALVGNGFLVGHGAAELALGIREVREEMSREEPAKLELAAGVLDAVKGGSTFLPLLFPETSTAVNIFQIGAILTKTAMEPHMRRSREA